MTAPLTRLLFGSRRAMRRWIALAAAPVALLGALALSPWAPGAVDRPAARLAAGDAEGALGEWITLSQGWGPPELRAEAAWRAAQVATFELRDPTRAEALLMRLLADWPQGPRAAEAQAALARLVAAQPERAQEAAGRLAAAAALSPGAPQAGRWLLTAARMRADAGDPLGSEGLFLQATAHPDSAGAAWLGLARIRLSADPAQAYDAASRALVAANHPDDARVAQLAIATALEQLEGPGAALAELDGLAGGDADASLTRRRERLRAAR
jgi:hypothetical protein